MVMQGFIFAEFSQSWGLERSRGCFGFHYIGLVDTFIIFNALYAFQCWYSCLINLKCHLLYILVFSIVYIVNVIYLSILIILTLLLIFPRCNAMIYEALSTLKEPNGSDISAIVSFIEVRQKSIIIFYLFFVRFLV